MRKQFAFALMVFLILVIGIFDYATGYDIYPAILYLLPITYVSLTMNRAYSLMICILSSAVLFVAETGHSVSMLIISLNVIVTMCIFFIVSFSFSALRRSLAVAKKQKARLEELNRLKSMFVGILAHDLRNPLNVISMSSSVAMSQPGKRKHYLSMIKSNSDFTLRMMDDLLDLSKMESGKLSFSLASVDYNGLIMEAIESNRQLSGRKGISIAVEDEKGIRLQCDRDRMKQVLNNLLYNAICYSEKDSGIIVRVKRSGQHVVTEIIDHGQGIPGDEINALFREYHDGPAKGTAGEKSTGLGLMISRKIVEGHGGEIGVRSTPGKETCFFYTLPAP